MTEKKQCFFLETLRTKQIRKGVFWLSENSSPGGGWLAVDTKEVLGNVSRHQGLSLLKELFEAKDNIAKISGVVIKLVTKENIPTDGEDKPLLAISPSKKFLDRIDMIPNISQMMVAPHGADEVDDWARRNNAKYYYDVQANSKTKIVELDPVVKVALEDLTNTINSIRQRNPSAYCFEIMTSTLNILDENGYEIDPATIGNYLVEPCGLGPVSAKLVEELAEDLKSGSREFFSSDLIHYWKSDKDTLERWKAKAEK